MLYNWALRIRLAKKWEMLVWKDKHWNTLICQNAPEKAREGVTL